MAKNERKILESLNAAGTELTVSEVSNHTGIDLSNISRYWKKMEEEGLIHSRTKQQGKIRTIYLSLEMKPSIKPIAKPKPSKKIELRIPTPEKKTRTITEDRVRTILKEETDHTDKYLKNLILKGVEVTLSDLLHKKVTITVT